MSAAQDQHPRMSFIVSSRRLLLSCAPLLAAAVAAACGTKDGGSSFDSRPNASGSTSSVGVTGVAVTANSAGFGDAGMLMVDSGPAGPVEPTTKVAGMMYTDFPADPVLDAPDGGGAAAPANAATLFGGPTQGASSGGPCLIEPEIGALYPDNWLRPRFRWVASANENLFELRLHVANQVNDLVDYTASNEWTMPKAQWDALRADSYDEVITVTVRGGGFGIVHSFEAV
jgi:hypothetical protein